LEKLLKFWLSTNSIIAAYQHSIGQVAEYVVDKDELTFKQQLQL